MCLCVCECVCVCVCYHRYLLQVIDEFALVLQHLSTQLQLAAQSLVEVLGDALGLGLAPPPGDLLKLLHAGPGLTL